MYRTLSSSVPGRNSAPRLVVSSFPLLNDINQVIENHLTSPHQTWEQSHGKLCWTAVAGKYKVETADLRLYMNT